MITLSRELRSLPCVPCKPFPLGFLVSAGKPPDLPACSTASSARPLRGVQPPTLNSSASALRFFFGATLDRVGCGAQGRAIAPVIRRPAVARI